VQAQTAFDFCQRPVRTKQPGRLFFALMPDEASLFALNACADRLLFGLEATRVKPIVALQHLTESQTVLFGAKLAGQAVPAAGLVVKFDTIGTVSAERRFIALTSTDPALARLHADLNAAILRNGLRADGAAPFIPLAHSAPRIATESIKPVKIRVTGLALLRGEAAGDFQVLRRWPLNTATNRSLTAKSAAR
jgi:hypothetical protein